MGKSIRSKRMKRNRTAQREENYEREKQVIAERFVKNEQSLLEQKTIEAQGGGYAAELSSTAGVVAMVDDIADITGPSVSGMDLDQVEPISGKMSRKVLKRILKKGKKGKGNKTMFRSVIADKNRILRRLASKRKAKQLKKSKK